MNEWKRIDYERIDNEERWPVTLISSDPVSGVPRWLVLYLALAIALLALSSAM